MSRTSTRTTRLLVLAAAWVVPVVWVLVALLAGPSDGTSLSSRLLPSAAPLWDESARIAATYGDTPLRVGDEVERIDGRSVGEWLGDAGSVTREAGDVVRYEVRRGSGGLDLIQQVDVTLTSYPLGAAVRAAPHVVLTGVLVLVVGSLVFWAQPAAPAARAFLVATALLPAAATSSPFGTSAIDLAGGGLWPQVVGEVLAGAGLVALVLSVVLLTRPEGRDRWVAGAVVALPLVGYAGWLVAGLTTAETAPARLAVLVAVAAPTLWAAVPALVIAGALSSSRAEQRPDVRATRLALQGLVAAVVGWLVLGWLPEALLDGPLVRTDLLVVLAAGFALACLAVAAAQFRLDDIEPRIRRGLVQSLVLLVAGAAFVGVVGAADAAADLSVGSVLTGGLLAVVLLPLAVALQRTVRRLVYGDREFPHRVVSDLRRLDALSAPEDALREVLDLLARRLHLSYAAVEVPGTEASEPVAASIGTPSGASPATIDLAVGGARMGSLRVEVDAGHDPFGPGDRRLLEDVGTQVGALVQAVVANRELQRSRQRLVAAREEERRRLRRDLHDGLGPSLATLAMRLEAATDLIRDDPDGAADLVARLSDQARDDIAEVRRLVEGLRPPALDQLGLVSALRHRAAEHTDGSGAVLVPWTVEADDGLDPLPAAVEVAAYRIVSEAVTNVQRHSGADRCTVRLTRDDSHLDIEVADTGSGLAEDRRAGVGLSSMRERAEELGGSFEVVPRAEGGTVVRVRLPLDQDARPDQ